MFENASSSIRTEHVFVIHIARNAFIFRIGHREPLILEFRLAMCKFALIAIVAMPSFFKIFA